MEIILKIGKGGTLSGKDVEEAREVVCRQLAEEVAKLSARHREKP